MLFVTMVKCVGGPLDRQLREVLPSAEENLKRGIAEIDGVVCFLYRGPGGVRGQYNLEKNPLATFVWKGED